MSKFMEVYEPIEEGWGTFLYKFASFVLPRPLNAVKAVASNLMLKKLLNDNDMKSYLQDECKAIVDRERKKDPTITEKLPADPITLAKRWWHSNDGVSFFSRKSLMSDSNNIVEDKIFGHNVGPYKVTFFYDSSNIEAAVLLLYSKKYDKCKGVKIPVPSMNKLNKK